MAAYCACLIWLAEGVPINISENTVCQRILGAFQERANTSAESLVMADISALFSDSEIAESDWRAAVDDLLVAGQLEWVYVPTPCLRLTAAGRVTAANVQSTDAKADVKAVDSADVEDRKPVMASPSIASPSEPADGQNATPQLKRASDFEAESRISGSAASSATDDEKLAADQPDFEISAESKQQQSSPVTGKPSVESPSEDSPAEANDPTEVPQKSEAEQQNTQADAEPVIPPKLVELSRVLEEPRQTGDSDDGAFGDTKRFYVPSNRNTAPKHVVPIIEEDDEIAPIIAFWERHRRRLMLLAAVLTFMSLVLFWWTRTTYLVPDNAVVAGQQLLLNGYGDRIERGVISVYQVALYVPQRSTDPSFIHKDAGAKRIVVRFVRKIDPDEMLTSLLEAVRPNLSPDDLTELQREFDLLRETFATMADGEPLYIDYVPEKGTLFSRGKNILLRMPSEDLFHAILDIWIGDEPVSYPLKRRLLGLPAE